MKPLIVILLSIIILTGCTFRIGPSPTAPDYHQGYSDALKEVEQIIEAQLKSDTTVTELVFINPDTVTYYLQPKDL